MMNVCRLIALLFGMLAAGCSGTKILESTVGNIEGPIDLTGQNVAILALTGDLKLRQEVENEFVELMADEGIVGLALHTVISGSDARDKDVVRAALAEAGADFVVALELLDTEEVTYYDTMSPYDSYDASFYTFYDYRYVTNPFLWERTYTTFTVKTLVYRVEDGELVWKAVSESFAPGSPRTFAKELTAAAKKTLKREGVLK